ncbi:AMP-binding protein, partial [Kibdelosporangium lantanae]
MDLATGQVADWAPTGPNDPVINLLTSGSTGVPKCVQHRNHSISARTWATARANGFDEHEVSLNWMPLDHVGGMVMFNVRDVFLGCEHVNATTEAFVARPLSWLDWTERYRATNTWAPNFAFALVNDQAEAIAAGSWDLSTLRNICNAGEAVVSRTAHRFLELLTPH